MKIISVKLEVICPLFELCGLSLYCYVVFNLILPCHVVVYIYEYVTPLLEWNLLKGKNPILFLYLTHQLILWLVYNMYLAKVCQMNI